MFVFLRSKETLFWSPCLISAVSLCDEVEIGMLSFAFAGSCSEINLEDPFRPCTLSPMGHRPSPPSAFGGVHNGETRSLEIRHLAVRRWKRRLDDSTMAPVLVMQVLLHNPEQKLPNWKGPQHTTTRTSAKGTTNRF